MGKSLLGADGWRSDHASHSGNATGDAGAKHCCVKAARGEEKRWVCEDEAQLSFVLSRYKDAGFSLRVDVVV